MTDNYLRRDNPRLLELEKQYAEFGGPALSLWRDHQRNFNIEAFRADGGYVGQQATEAQYLNAVEYIVTDRDDHNYFDLLHEDSAFGITTYDLLDHVVSRDLLDSILEIYFLQDTLGFNEWDSPLLMDIGAGYGRFAHRFVTAFLRSTVYCTDAVPVSTFVSEFYLKYRNESLGARVVPLPIAEKFIHSVDVAVNIHSWSECSLESINWWLDLLRCYGVRYLFVVPHDSRWVCVNADGSIGEFKTAIERHGYRLIREQPKFPQGVNGIYSEAVYTLWRR